MDEGGWTHVPVIARTSYAMAGNREKIMRDGCNGHFEKPINPLTIISDTDKPIEGCNDN